VREDPDRRGLLFAGTEQAVFVSFDDGEQWQSLRGHMPATSIRDLVIKGDDLVVGTHGRSFWILDDITPLRQLSAEATAAEVHLFKPQRAWRYRSNKNTDTPLPPDEPAGQNPPDGALVHYLLARDAGSVTFEVVDRGGTIVRTYSSSDPEEPFVEGRNTPDYWLRPHRALSSKAGLHRFVWDLHYERPAVPSFSYPIAAIYLSTPQTPLGSWVVPGTYTVRLTVDGRAVSQPLTVEMDPRVKISIDDLKRQHDVSRGIDAALARVSASLQAGRGDRAVLTRLQGQLVQLFGVVEQSDAAPTAATLEAWNMVAASLDAALGAR